MKFDTFVSSSIVNPLHNALYNPPLAVLASTSTASLWSDASSQHPEDATSNGSASDSEASDCFSIAPISSSQTSVSSLGSYCEPRSQLCDPWAAQQIEQQPQYNLPPVELRQNPRRTSNSATSRTGRPPTLVRQDDRKGTFVDNLIGKEHSPGHYGHALNIFLSRNLHPHRRGHLADVICGILQGQW